MPAAVMTLPSAPNSGMSTASSLRRRPTPIRAAALASSSRVTLEDFWDQELSDDVFDEAPEDSMESVEDEEDEPLVEEQEATSTPKASTHSGTRAGKGRFHCEWPGCLWSFPRQAKLQNHLRIHTDERPFKCSLQECDAAFKRKEHLKAHEERVHAAKADVSSSQTPQEDESFASTSELPMPGDHKKFMCQHLVPVAASSSASAGLAGKGKARDVVEVSTLECGKRFWTKQHLERHVLDVHEDEDTLERVRIDSGDHRVGQEGGPNKLIQTKRKQYQCTEPGCSESFVKRKRLREHIWTKHSLLPEKGLGSAVRPPPIGTTPSANAASGSIEKPFVCGYAGCGRAFLTMVKRKQHSKVHAEGRYTCSLPHSNTTSESTSPDRAQEVLEFSTWSALQNHMREAHPPMCPHPHCAGKVFKSGAVLNKHMKQHREEHTGPASIHGSETFTRSEGDDGNVHAADGDDIACPWAGCSQTFKSNRSMKSHYSIRHLGIKKFVCGVTDVGQGSHSTTANAEDAALSSVDDVAKAAATLRANVGCGRPFGHKHELVRHLRICEVRKMEALLASMEAAAAKDGKVLSGLGSMAKARNRDRRNISSGAGNSEMDGEDDTAFSHDKQGDHTNSGEDIEQEGFMETSEAEMEDELFREEGGAVPQRLAERPAAPERSTRNAITHSQVRELLGIGRRGESGQSAPGKKRSAEAAGLDGESKQGILEEWREYLPAALVGGQKKRRRSRGAMLTCPWRRLNEIAQESSSLAGEDDGEQESEMEQDPINTQCEARFSRVYDLSRHLKSVHALRLSDGDILELVPEQERMLLPKSRK